MENVKKMALVPQAMIDKLLEAQRDQQQLVNDSPIQQLSLLDGQLKTVLDGKLPADIKSKEYARILQQYSTIRNKEVRPRQYIPDITDNLLVGLPNQWKKKAQAVLQSVMKNEDLGLNDKNEIIYKGDRVPGSNITDLVHTFVTPSKRKPAGWKEFGQALVESNVPRTFISNENLLKEVDKPEEPVASNPLVPLSPKTKRTPRSKRTRKPKAAWSPY
jgi:hypothetical protein